MTKVNFRREDLDFLRQLVAERAPELLFIVEQLERGKMTNEERNLLIDEVLSLEFMRAGLREDWEPNEYGLRIHRLIEALPIQEE